MHQTKFVLYHDCWVISFTLSYFVSVLNAEHLLNYDFSLILSSEIEWLNLFSELTWTAFQWLQSWLCQPVLAGFRTHLFHPWRREEEHEAVRHLACWGYGALLVLQPKQKKNDIYNPHREYNLHNVLHRNKRSSTMTNRCIISC